MKFLKSIKKDEIMGTVTRTVSKYGYKLKKASPTIMIVGAAIGGVTATVLACNTRDVYVEGDGDVFWMSSTDHKIEVQINGKRYCASLNNVIIDWDVK